MMTVKDGQDMDRQDQLTDIAGQRGDAMKRVQRAGSWMILLAIVGTMAMGGCHRSSSPHAGRSSTPVPVKAVLPESTGGTREMGVAGVVRGIHEALLSARVAGEVREVRVRLGQKVDQGQVLLTLSSRTLGADLSRAAARRDFAASNYDRINRLYQDRSASRAEWESARQERDEAEAAYSAAQARLGWTHVTAPFPGRVVSRVAQVGEEVLPGTPLLTVADDRRLEVVAHIPDALVSGLSRSSVVRFVTHGHEYKGRLVEISSGSDPVTHTVPVKVLLSPIPKVPGKKMPRELRPGGYGKLYIPVPGRAAIRVPDSALIDHEGLRELFVLNAGHAELRYVRVGRSVGGMVEILSGLSPQEKVVLSPPATLVDGARVSEVAQ